MKKASTQTIDTLKNQLLNETILWVGIIFTPGVMISLSRAFFIGWMPLMVVHLMLFAFIWILWLGHRKLAYRTRILGLLSLMWIASIAGLIQLGPLGLAGIFTVSFSFIAVLFLGDRRAWWLIAANICSLIGIGIAASQHWLRFNVDYTIYAYHPLTWVHTIWTFSAYSLVFALFGWRLIGWLISRELVLNQSTEKLRESEQHFRTLANAGSALIWTSDANKLCNYFNEPWLNFTGRTLEQELGNGWTEGVHPDDFEDCLSIYVAAFDKRQAFSMEYRLRHTDGSYHWILDDGTPRFDSQGLFLGYIGFCYDITPQRALRNRLNKLSLSVEQSTNSIMITNLDAEIEYVNPRFTEITGYTQEEVLGTNPRILQSGGTPRSVYDELWARLSQGESWEGEFADRRKDGSEYIEYTQIYPLRDDKGVVTHYVSVKEDITQKKKTEDDLRKLWLAVEQSPSSIMITNLEGNLEYVNQCFTEITGYSCDEVLGKNPRMLKSGLTPPETFISLWDNLGKGETWRGEFINRRKDGIDYTEGALVAPVRQSDGRTSHYLSISQDITETKRQADELTDYRQHLELLVTERTNELAETMKQLKVGEERLSYAMDATNDGVWDWDIITNQCYTNIAYFSMLGYEFGEIPSDAKSAWVDLLHPDDAEKALAETAQLLENDEYHEIEFRLRAKDGSYKWILSRRKVVKRDDKGNAVRAVGTHTDLTARKQFEIQLQEAKEKAEIASRAKSSFLANMSHEIRTPMNAILGFSHTLALDLTEPTQRDKLEKISLSARHLLNIINDVLDLSKIEANQLQPEAIPFNVVTLINQVHSMMIERFQEKHLTLQGNRA